MKVEYLIAWEDGTWTTETFDVPIDTPDNHDAETWMQDGPALTAAYRKAVYWGVYCYLTDDDGPVCRAAYDGGAR